MNYLELKENKQKVRQKLKGNPDKSTNIHVCKSGFRLPDSKGKLRTPNIELLAFCLSQLFNAKTVSKNKTLLLNKQKQGRIHIRQKDSRREAGRRSQDRYSR